MEHVVFFTGPDRSPQFRRTPSLDEAVRFVESLRNGEGIDDSKVYSLTEVPLRFQTYYRVEVPADAAPSAPPQAPPAAEAAPAAPAEAPQAAAAEPTAFAPVEAPSAQAGATFESVAAGAEASTAGQAAEQVAVETLPPPPAVETLEPQPDGLTGAEGESADGPNGKPHRGLGFFAR